MPILRANLARATAQAIESFKSEHPKYGRVLQETIDRKRAERETHLYFGMQEGRLVPKAEYMAVMQDLGFTEATSESLYPELMDISYKLAKKRGTPASRTERSILVS